MKQSKIFKGRYRLLEGGAGGVWVTVNYYNVTYSCTGLICDVLSIVMKIWGPQKDVSNFHFGHNTLAINKDLLLRP